MTKQLLIMVLPLTLLFVVCGCDNTTSVTGDTATTTPIMPSNSSKTVEESASGWRRDPEKLVDHLNDWHHDERILYNERDTRRNQTTSGETNGWISAHLEELKKARCVSKMEP